MDTQVTSSLEISKHNIDQICKDVMDVNITCYKYLHSYPELNCYSVEERKAYLERWRAQGEFSDAAFVRSLSEVELYRLIFCDGRVFQTGYYGDDLQTFLALDHSPPKPGMLVLE